MEVIILFNPEMIAYYKDSWLYIESYYDGSLILVIIYVDDMLIEDKLKDDTRALMKHIWYEVFRTNDAYPRTLKHARSDQYENFM